MNINQLTAKEIKFYSRNGGAYCFLGFSIVWNGHEYILYTGREIEYDNTSYKTLKELKKAIRLCLYK